MRRYSFPGFTIAALSVLAALFFRLPSAEDLELRQAAFSVGSFAGCRIEGGEISLLDRMYSQIKGVPLVMEAEDAYSLVFQDDVFARKETGIGGGNIVQIKRSAKEYAPQFDDPGAVGGYVDYCSRAVYQFRIVDDGDYYIWVRHWLPFLSSWDYLMSVDGGAAEKIRISPQIAAAKTWTWVRCRAARLSSGVHSLGISHLANGKRMDRILMTRDSTFVPVGDAGIASPSQPVDEGIVHFNPLLPVGIAGWGSLGWVRKEGVVDFRASNDAGLTWHSISDANIGTVFREPKQILLEARLRRCSGGSPLLCGPSVSYSCDAKRFVVVEGGATRLYFDRSTGALTGVENAISGSFYMPLGTTNGAFSLTLKRPGRPERERVVSHGITPEIRFQEKNRVVFSWRAKDGGVEVSLDVVVDSAGLARCEFSVNNGLKEWDILEFEMLRIEQVRVSRRAVDDVLVWPFTAGEIVRGPASRWEMAVEYPDHAGFPWFDLSGGDGGLYVGMHDPVLVGTVFTSMPGVDQESMGFSLLKRHRIRAGGKQVYSFVVAAHEGDWHAAARIYRSYFYSKYHRNESPNWLRESIGWVSGGALNGRDSKAVYADLERDFKRAAFLGMPYIQGWGSTMNGACPTYYAPRRDRGGEDSLAEMIRRWRSVGGSIGYYFHGNSLGSYYSLSPTYFGVPWSEYPEDQRPWPWKRYIENAFYPSESFVFDRDRLMGMVNAINDRIARGEPVGNKDIEGMDDYQPFNWSSPDFPEYLKKWVKKYVSQYGCNTAYLDTFAFYNGRPDFNLHLGHHGESDMAMHKLPWLLSFMREMRKADSSFSCLTEGVLDVFGGELSFLLSGFQRDANVMRYMLPDQIFYLGNSNALWTEPLSRKSLSNAFLFGMKYDLIAPFPHSYYMVRLMQRTAPFLSRAVFDDDIGLKIDDPSVRAFAHVMTAESSMMMENHGQRAVAITFHNPEGRAAMVEYALPRGFQVRKAFSLELYKGAALEFDVHSVGEGKVSFRAPAAESAAIILVDSLPPPYAVTAISRQRDRGTVEVELCNYSDAPAEAVVVASGSGVKLVVDRRSIVIPPGAVQRMRFEDGDQSDLFRPLLIEVFCGGRTQRLISGLGALGISTPPVPRVASREESKREVLVDFEEGEEVCVDQPYRGRGCLRVAGKGRLSHESVRLRLMPETEYDISFAMRKSAGVGRSWLAVSNYTKDGRLETFGSWGADLKGDGNWQVVRGRFRTAAELGDRCSLYIYNEGSVPVWCDEISLRAVSVPAGGGGTSVSSVVPGPGAVERRILALDFDGKADLGLVNAALSSDRPFRGSYCLALVGDGGYRFERFPLSLQPGGRYRIRAAIRKGATCASEAWQSMIGICSYDENGKLERHGFWGGEVKLDDCWHIVGGEFTAPLKMDRCALYCYNLNSVGTASFDEVTIEDVR